jgi:hypothetical protein
MKLTVVTGKAGKIIGTYRPAEHAKPEVGSGGPIAGPGQKLSVIDMPKELERVTDSNELHRELKKHLTAKKK